MEKKSIGGFIAALRKANGMTQKELAERLNVSDKTVSRWERDDGAPDLALIPVIAEIFDVTCDELLRGERKSPTERADLPADNEPTRKGEKQRQRLLAVSLSKYKTRSFIAMGISAVGLIAAMVCNFGFLRAYIGFLIGTVFYLAAVICQAVFINEAFLSVSDDSLCDEEAGRFRWKVAKLAEQSLGLTAILLGFSLPLIIFTGDTFVGLGAESFFGFGVLFAAGALLLTATVCWFVNPSLLKNAFYRLSAKEEHSYYLNHKLKRNCTVWLVITLALTLRLHAFGSEMIWSAHKLAQGTTFNDYESFIAYMEQDIPYELIWDSGRSTQTPMQSAPAEKVPGSEETWYDENGNVVTEDEARTYTIKDINGNVVCTYVQRNEAVTSIRYSPKDGTALPITTFSEQEYRAANRLSGQITTVYCLLYPIELAVAFIIYFRKRTK